MEIKSTIPNTKKKTNGTEANTKTSGKGWIILKLSNELLGTNYDLYSGYTQNAVRSKEAGYKRIRDNVREVVEDVISNPNRNVRVESAGMDCNQIADVAKKILAYWNSVGLSSPKMLGVNFGYDPNGDWVRYADNVRNEEKVPGLVEYIESEYNEVVQFVGQIGLRVQNDYGKIHIILKKEIKFDSYVNTDRDKAEAIKRLVIRDGNDASIEKIMDIINNNGGSYPRWGEYIARKLNCQPYIIIYYKNISCDSMAKYKAIISQVLAHEYMHHVHCIYAVHFMDTGKTAKRVKEAIADFFSVQYLIETSLHKDIYANLCRDLLKIDVAKERYNAWLDNFGLAWPYAEALWFYLINGSIHDFNPCFDSCENRRLINKFLKVYYESSSNSDSAMRDAYSILRL